MVFSVPYLRIKPSPVGRVFGNSEWLPAQFPAHSAQWSALQYDHPQQLRGNQAGFLESPPELMLPWSQSGYTGFLQRIQLPERSLCWSGEQGPLFEACVLRPPKCTGVFSSEKRFSFQYLTNK